MSATFNLLKGERVKFIFIMIVVLVISGCSTYSANRYSNLTENVVSLRQYQENKISVGEFTATEPGRTSISCRGVGPIATPDGESFEQFIQNAFIAELQLAEAYDANAASKVSGNVDKIDFNSNSGYWYIDLTINSLSGESINISESFKYKTSFYGETACNQTAQALMPAVQNAISQTINHPKFSVLVE